MWPKYDSTFTFLWNIVKMNNVQISSTQSVEATTSFDPV